MWKKKSFNQSADLCLLSSSLCWSVVCWSWRMASCRPRIFAFFSFSTMTKREYSFLSNTSLSRTCCSSLVRKTHRHQCTCKNIREETHICKLHTCAHAHTESQITCFRSWQCLSAFWEQFPEKNDAVVSTLWSHSASVSGNASFVGQGMNTQMNN